MLDQFPERDCVRRISRSTLSISKALRLGLRPQPRSSFPATRNAGAGQDVTGLAAAVQLRLRVAFGLQALPRCSGLLNRRARGSTVATHHFGGGTRIEKSMRGFGADAQRYSFCLPLPPPFQTLP